MPDGDSIEYKLQFAIRLHLHNSARCVVPYLNLINAAQVQTAPPAGFNAISGKQPPQKS